MTLSRGLPGARRLIVVGLVALAVVAAPGAASAATVNCVGGGTFTVTGVEVVSSTADCSGAIVVPAGVTTIKASAFATRAITTVSLPSSLTTIEAFAFQDATSLTTVTFAGTMSSGQILYQAFSGASALQSITLPSGLVRIDDEAFASSGLTSLNIPAAVNDIGDNAFIGTIALTAFTVTSGNTSFHVDAAGVLFDTAANKLEQYPLGRTATSYTVPTGVASVRGNAFRDADFLQTVAFAAPGTTTSVGEFAFAYTGALVSVVLPDTVTTIGDSAFRSSNLSSVTLPTGLTRIRNSVFRSTRMSSLCFGS